MGLDPKEYSAPHGGGRLDVHQGLGLLGAPGPGLSSGAAGNCQNTSCPLWASKASLESYDIVFLACEGATDDADDEGDGGGLNFGGNGSNVTKAGKQAMHDWLDEGGKVFATHFHYTWFKNGPPDFQSVATWLGSSVGSGTCTNCSLDTTLQSGKNFQTWLQSVGALSGTGITLNGVADSVSAVNTANDRPLDLRQQRAGHGRDGYEVLVVRDAHRRAPGRRWRVERKEYCGKAVFTDLHAGGAPSGDIPGQQERRPHCSREGARVPDLRPVRQRRAKAAQAPAAAAEVKGCSSGRFEVAGGPRQGYASSLVGASLGKMESERPDASRCAHLFAQVA